MSHTGVYTKGSVLFSGGESTDSGKSQQLYNITSDSFTTKANLDPNRNWHKAVNVKENILISGGNYAPSIHESYILDRDEFHRG